MCSFKIKGQVSIRIEVRTGSISKTFKRINLTVSLAKSSKTFLNSLSQPLLLFSSNTPNTSPMFQMEEIMDVSPAQPLSNT